VPHVPRDHVAQRADADRLTAGSAPPDPSPGGQVPVQGEGRLPDGVPFLGQIGQCAVVSPLLRHVRLVVEGGQRGGIAAPYPEGR